MRCFKIDRRGPVVIERGFPAGHADAPLIAGLQSGKSPFGVRRYKIVPVENRKIEELARDLDANRMQTNVIRASPTIPVPVKSGHRIAATAFQFRSQDICGHNGESNLPNAAKLASGSVLIQTRGSKYKREAVI